MTEKLKHGGHRPGAGRPPLGKAKRQSHSVRLAPNTKKLAQAIAKSQGLPGWGRLIDELVRQEAKRLLKEKEL